MTAPRRASWRIFGALLGAYGIIGLLLSAVLAVSLAPALATLDAAVGTADGIERTLLTTRDAFDTFGASLVEGRRSAAQAATTARSTARTAGQLADAMSISIFGAQPLLGIASGFRQQSTDLDGLATTVDALAAALGRDEGDVRAVRDQLAALHDRVAALTALRSSGMPLGPVLYVLLAWMALQGLVSVGLGALLWRAG